MRLHPPALLLVLVGLALSGAEQSDDFSTGGWSASNPKAPATVTAHPGALVLADKPGGEVTWGSSCSKRYPEVDLAATPYVVIKVNAVTGGYGVKLAGGKDWPKKQVASGNDPGLVVVDIPKATGWKVGKGPLVVMLYTNGDGTTAEYGLVKFTSELTGDEQAAVKAAVAAAPGLAAPEHAGLAALAARRGAKPSVVDAATGERAAYTDPVTGHTVWRMTDHPAVERHVYFDIPAWNANGSVLHWVSRRPGGRLWLMDADGTNMRPLPPASDGGAVKAPHWSTTNPNRMYFVRAGETETAVFSLDIRDGAVAKVVGVPLPAVIGERRFNEFPPPHPDERRFLLRWGGQDRLSSLLVVVDAETGSFVKLEAGMPTHRVRFTKATDGSVFVNSNQDPDQPGRNTRSEWVLGLDGSKRRLPPIGGHPDWSPDGRWAAGYKDAGIWLISHDGSTRHELVHNGAGGHGGFSIASGAWHVGDSPRRGPYADLVYVTELATGLVVPVAYHGSSYSGWGSGVPDPEATHPAPICSPDETKIVYDSDLLGQPDVWVAIWRRPEPPREVRFADGTLQWTAPAKCREIAGYVVYRQEGGCWVATGTRRSELRQTGLPNAVYAVAAQEWSGLTSPPIVANQGAQATDCLAPPPPGACTVADRGPDHVALGLPPCDAPDFSHYNVYAGATALDGASRATLVGSPRHRRFVDWGLPPATTRYYRVTAVDWQGNESLPGPATSATTE